MQAYFTIHVDIPDVYSTFSISTSKDCRMNRTPLHIIDIFRVVLKGAEGHTSLSLKTMSTTTIKLLGPTVIWRSLCSFEVHNLIVQSKDAVRKR